METLKKAWNWLLGKTTIDEKIKETITEVKKEVSEVKAAVKEVKVAVKKAIKETSDVVDVIQKAAPKKKRYYANKKPATKVEPKAIVKK